MYSNFNIVVVSILSLILILIVLKLSEILAEDEFNTIDNEKYSTTILILCILMVVVFNCCFNDSSDYFIIKETFKISSIITLIYISLFQWSYFNNHYKLFILLILFFYILYLIK